MEKFGSGRALREFPTQRAQQLQRSEYSHNRKITVHDNLITVHDNLIIIWLQSMIIW